VWHRGAREPDIRNWYGGLIDGMRDGSGQMYRRDGAPPALPAGLGLLKPRDIERYARGGGGGAQVAAVDDRVPQQRPR
jgi:hypothetical protein